MATRPVEMDSAGLHAARAIEHLRLVRGLPQHQLAAHCTPLGRLLASAALGVLRRALVLPLALAADADRRGC